MGAVGNETKFPRDNKREVEVSVLAYKWWNSTWNKSHGEQINSLSLNHHHCYTRGQIFIHPKPLYSGISIISTGPIISTGLNDF